LRGTACRVTSLKAAQIATASRELDVLAKTY